MFEALRLALLATLPLLAAAAQDDKLDAAFALVKQAVEKDEIPGAVVWVARNGKVLREEAYGLSDIEAKTPFEKNTLCWIASITKPVTVAAAMTLVDAGKLSLDDPVEKFLPEFKEQKNKEGEHQAILIRHLMTHTSGLQRDSPTRKSTMGNDWRSQKIEDIAKAVAGTALQSKPGEKFSYSNAGMIVLGRVIEVVAEKPYADCVQEKILDPLGMKDSYFRVPAGEAKRVAKAYSEKKGKRKAYFTFDPDFKVVNTSPAGGLFSTPAEMLKFFQMFLDNDGKVLSKASVDEMLKEQVKGRGLGWALKGGVFSHTGSSGTYGFADPKSGIVAFLFIQCEDDAGKLDALRAMFFKAVRAAFN